MSTSLITARRAIKETIASELARERTAVFIGETVRGLGAAGVAEGLYEQFGPQQVIEAPVSENGIFGAALGMALGGMRPIVEIYAADFLLAVANEVINDIAKWRHQQTQPSQLPIVIRGCMGADGGLGPEHSQSMEAYFHHAPGLTILVPSTAGDLAGLTRAAIRSDEPTLVFEHRKIYDLVGEVPDDPEFTVPIGKAEVLRRGTDITLVAWGWMRHEANMAADQLSEHGISVDLIDPRTIRPMDWGTIIESVARTGRLLVVEESPKTGSVSAEIIARAVEEGPTGLVAKRVTMPDAIHPYSASMERELLPSKDKIARGAADLCGLRVLD